MVSLSLRKLLQILAILSICSSISFAYADCQSYVDALPSLKQEIATLDASSHFLEQIQKGNVTTKMLPAGKGLSSLFKMPLDNETKVASGIQLLKSQAANLRVPLSLTEELDACAVQGEVWLSLTNQHRQAEHSLIKQKLAFLKQPPNIRAVIVRQLNHWAKIESVAEALSLKKPEFEQNETVLIELEHLHDWLASYQAIFGSWYAMYRSDDAEFTHIDSIWLATLVLPSPEEALMEQDALTREVSEAADWLYLMSETRSSLFKDVSRWRNQALLNQGWLAFLSQLSSPSTFFEGLFKEVVSAPKNFLDNLSRPFIKEYKLAAKEDRQLTLLLAWVSQVLGLMLLAFALIKVASGSTSWLASLQQSLVAKISGPSLHSFISGIFWIIKPNASWLFILLSANTLVWFFHEDWQILSLIAPLGTIYAVFRGLRVVIEWGLSRTYTRSDMFLSSQAAEQLVRDSQRIAWVALGCVLFWWLAFGAGGGYSIYLISLIDVVILWFASLWLLSRHKAPVDKLLEKVLRKKLSADKTELGFVLKAMLSIAWPLVFLFVNIIDVLFSINQKMMVFDVYRSLSVKLLRVRLESRSEDVIEEDEPEPDQSYTDWMLREVSDDSLFDVGDVSGFLEPLKKWFADKTDENVTVVVGESGSGKSTLIRRLPDTWDQTPIKKLDVHEKLSKAEDFYQQLSELLGIALITDAGGLVKQDKNIEQQVVVIDSAHNLFMAEVGYFNAYRALMECMNAHLENIYWVVVLNAPSWNYLSYVFAREQRVSNVFKMPRWSPMDIRKLILSRHKGGKRRLKYNNLLLSAAASSESSSIRAADSRVFNILWEQSGGNPLAAIELWLDAVKVKGRLAEVGVPQRPSANLLNGMKDDLYFVYTAIVLHASLSTEEIMLVTHFSESMVRHAVKQGINMGMIVRDDSRRYKIDPYWYGSLSGFLHRKNLLWN